MRVVVDVVDSILWMLVSIGAYLMEQSSLGETE